MHDVVCKLYDLDSNELADISEIALERAFHRQLNHARGFSITAVAGSPLLTATAPDGYRTLKSGNRKLLVWEDGEIIFHGRVFTVERNGDGRQNLVTINAYDPWMELGYESEERAGRPVRDATGNLITPKFVSSVDGGAAISGPDLIRQVLVNSEGNPDTIDDPNLHEGPLPIDLDFGDFDLIVPPAVDLSCVDSMDWPVLIGDFITQMVDTNVVDVEMRPVDPDEGFDPYVMVSLSAVSRMGVDRSGSVHFDYFTGDHNALACRHVEDFSTVCNKLVDFLGPRLDIEHWKGNITPSRGTVDVDPSRLRYGGSGAEPGEFMYVRMFDSVGDENSHRPLYNALWDAEQSLRLDPRQLLYITPSPDAKALFEAPQQFDAGDVVAINVGAEFGLELADEQRVYGYDKTWDRQGVARISQLLTSADVT